MCKHIALILDGNRRWGKKNGLGMSFAYKKGAERLQEIVLELIELKISYATIYGFSFENWNRSLYEISVIMVSFLSFLEANRSFFVENNIRVVFIGDLSFFDNKISSIMFEMEEITKKNSAILVQLAVSYSGRNEILRAIQISEASGQDFESCLYTSGIQEPDLLIRTGGCYRLSNFLLWQLAYTELFFIEKLWPDFTRQDLHEILNRYKFVNHNNGI